MHFKWVFKKMNNLLVFVANKIRNYSKLAIAAHDIQN